MRKVIIITVFVTILMSGVTWAEKVADLPEIMKPTDSMLVHDGRLYLTEGATVFIYSLSDYKLIKKFGQQGEGPQEFKRTPLITPWKGELLMFSPGKLSYYTKDGEFVREKKVTNSLAQFIQPVKQGFVSIGAEIIDQEAFGVINLLDGELKKIKSLIRFSAGKIGSKQKLLKKTFLFAIIKDNIAVINSEEFSFDILNHEGKKLKTVTKDFKRRSFTKEDEKQLDEILRLRLGRQYEAFKNIFEMPKGHWPAIMALSSADDKLFVPTYNYKDDKILFFIYDSEGNELKNIFIPFVMRNALQPFPSAINGGKLYQVIENEDEEWELHISKID